MSLDTDKPLINYESPGAEARLAMPQPEAYIGGAAKLFDDNVNLTNESTKEFIKKFMEAFAKWVDTNAKK